MNRSILIVVLLVLCAASACFVMYPTTLTPTSTPTTTSTSTSYPTPTKKKGYGKKGYGKKGYSKKRWSKKGSKIRKPKYGRKGRVNFKRGQMYGKKRFESSYAASEDDGQTLLFGLKKGKGCKACHNACSKLPKLLRNSCRGQCNLVCLVF